MVKHKAFISYYHNDDQWYKEELSKWNKNNGCFIDGSVEIGDINDQYMEDKQIYQKIRDQYLSDVTVTIVLLGLNTQYRKHVDREIGSSLRDTSNNSRCGLVIIILPEFEKIYGKSITQANSGERIADNIRNKYAEVISWNEINYANLSNVIEKAYNKRFTMLPDNSAKYRRRNGN